MAPSPKTLRRILIASLIANFFFIAYIGAGWIAATSGGPGVTGKERRFDPAAALASLDKKYRKQVREIWRVNRDELRANQRQMRKGRREVGNMLTAKTVDVVALEARLESLRRRSGQSRAAVHQILLDLIAVLPDDQRRKYFKHGIPRMSRAAKRGARKKKS